MRKDFEYWLDAATKHPDATMPTPWQIWQAAVEAEREACAKVCDGMNEHLGDSLLDEASAAIRARSNAGNDPRSRVD